MLFGRLKNTRILKMKTKSEVGTRGYLYLTIVKVQCEDLSLYLFEIKLYVYYGTLLKEKLIRTLKKPINIWHFQ